ncbi:hypothetical protein APHNP_0939 [Anaplasma phagocytophilum str. ApNP]|uniref:Uncharacterized protein n=1 Tax=Anaplasma phagocytophilum str. ApNP TaxID=1359153 RepID=A0A0F3NG75_ANAPH|nr:hypothetical protein APHNP_0939 [Anaplasma phagocytophilum str. ApNP]
MEAVFYSVLINLDCLYLTRHLLNNENICKLGKTINHILKEELSYMK